MKVVLVEEGKWDTRTQPSLPPSAGAALDSSAEPLCSREPSLQMYMGSKESGDSKVLNFFKGLVRKDIILNLRNSVKIVLKAWLLKVEL